MSKKTIFAALFAAVGFAIAGTAIAASVSLSWTAPTTRTDGSALAASEIGGYEIDLNGAPIATPTASTTSYSHAIAAGACVAPSDQFTIRAKDSAGTWSAFSTPVSLASQACTPKPAPTAPTLKAVVGP